ncbi:MULTISPECIES: glycosyltransferase [Francisella]|uniref:Glycosyltransferase n=1 Tax=Francisella salimarina TaxID=2599927 RepID=A0AAJ4TKC9_9GAMM|nr:MULTISPECIES: glycosyltransferase [Francisella]QWU98698.1 glycosyltransferase [Francisella salimarina]
MKKVLILSNASGYGGAEKSIELVIQELVKLYRVDVLVENDEHENSISKKANIISLPKGNKILSIVKSLNIILNLCKTNTYCNILINTNKGAFFISILSFLGLFKKTNILIYIRDFQWKYQHFISFFLKRKNVKYIITTKAFFDYKSFFSKKIIDSYEIIPNWTSEPILGEKEIVDRKIILLPAMINRWKGIDYLIESSKKIENIVIFEIWIIGKIIDNEYFKELKDLIDRLELSDKVKFFSYKKDLSYYYNNADVVVNSSISKYGGPETFGRTIIEAWSYGKPVISFDCGGPRYLIEDGVNGYLVKEANVTALALALEKVFSEGSDLGMNAYYTYCEKYSKKAVIKQLLNIFTN